MPKRPGTAALNGGPLNSACAYSPVDKRRVGREATCVGWTCSLGLSGASGASPWQGEVQALFLRHEGYLGAIGAFLKGAEQDSEYSVAYVGQRHREAGRPWGVTGMAARVKRRSRAVGGHGVFVGPPQQWQEPLL